MKIYLTSLIFKEKPYLLSYSFNLIHFSLSLWYFSSNSPYIPPNICFACLKSWSYWTCLSIAFKKVIFWCIFNAFDDYNWADCNFYIFVGLFSPFCFFYISTLQWLISFYIDFLWVCSSLFLSAWKFLFRIYRASNILS
jgi:hypothetical protein